MCLHSIPWEKLTGSFSHPRYHSSVKMRWHRYCVSSNYDLQGTPENVSITTWFSLVEIRLRTTHADTTNTLPHTAIINYFMIIQSKRLAEANEYHLYTQEIYISWEMYRHSHTMKALVKMGLSVGKRRSYDLPTQWKCTECDQIISSSKQTSGVISI